MTQRKPRFIELVSSAIEHGESTADELARELSVTPAEIATAIEESRAMSLAHQLCVAAFIIERVPRLRRQGYALRAQVVAAMRVEARLTTLHNREPAWR